MEQSEEIRDLLASLIETFGKPQWGRAFISAMSEERGVLLVGMDPAEWWDNVDHMQRALHAQTAELQGASAEVNHSEGWVQGEVGWGAVKADVVALDGPPVAARVTATLARGPVGWKIVQFHASVGATNEEVFGQELTV